MQKSFKSWQKVLLVGGLVVGLASVRFFENVLFYDPLVAYFKGESMALPIPALDFGHLLWGYFCRFWINTALSLAVIFVLFQD